MPGGEQQFARVDKVLMFGIAFKRMPVFSRNEVRKKRRAILTSGMTATAYHQSVPVRTDGCDDSFRGSITHDAANHATIHIATADASVHFGVKRPARRTADERAGGGVHHKGVVHALMRKRSATAL